MSLNAINQMDYGQVDNGSIGSTDLSYPLVEGFKYFEGSIGF